MKKVKQARPNNSGESVSIQSKKTPPPLIESARRFQRALNDVEDELDESLAWAQTDNERIRLLTFRQTLGALREASFELVKAKGCQPESKTPQETGSARHMTARNIWVKIGFSPVEMAAVRKIRSFHKGNAGLLLSQIIRMLFVSSLAHYGANQRHFEIDQNYARAEGFIGTEHYQEAIIRKAFGLKQVGIDKWE